MSKIWFCRECKRKGELPGTEIFFLVNAIKEHEICSPKCEELIRSVSEEEAEKDSEIKNFKDWADE